MRWRLRLPTWCSALLPVRQRKASAGLQTRPACEYGLSSAPMMRCACSRPSSILTCKDSPRCSVLRGTHQPWEQKQDFAGLRASLAAGRQRAATGQQAKPESEASMTALPNASVVQLVGMCRSQEHTMTAVGTAYRRATWQSWWNLLQRGWITRRRPWRVTGCNLGGANNAQLARFVCYLFKAHSLTTYWFLCASLLRHLTALPDLRR